MGIRENDPGEIPEHYDPIGKAQSIEFWRRRGRLPVPSLAGMIVDLVIVSLYETTAVDGLPLDCLIEAQKTVNETPKQFGVVFSANPPDWHKYKIPVLWRKDGISGVGRWK